MLAFHSTSTAPYFAKRINKDSGFRTDAFDLYCTVLSALLWRRYNGEIVMLTDRASYDYYKKLGIEKIWNSMERVIPDDLEGINPVMFWAAGKLLSLRNVQAPCVMLDTDFIVWEKLNFSNSILAAHSEEISHEIYPPFSYFNMKQGYNLRKEFNSDILPLNTAFLYLPDEDFKQFYTGSSLEFMKSAQDSEDYLCYMVFAEQRMLTLCADYLKQPVDVLLDKDRLFESQNKFTHLWGAKQIMRNDKKEEKSFCKRCRERIIRDYPEYSYLIDIIENERGKPF